MSVIWLEDWNYIGGKLGEKYYVYSSSYNQISDTVPNPFGQPYTHRASYNASGVYYAQTDWGSASHHVLIGGWFYPTVPEHGNSGIIQIGNSGGYSWPNYGEVWMLIQGGWLRFAQRNSITGYYTVASGELYGLNTWNYLEIEHYHNNSGFCQAWLNGKFLGRYNGDMYYDSNPHNTILWRGQSFSGSQAPIYYGPFFVIDMLTAPNNTSPIGPSRAHRLIATAAGNYTQWDVSGETDNYAALNDQTVEDDYVYTSVSGEIDTYVMQDIDPNVTLLAVKPDFRAKDDGTSKNIGTVFRSNDGTDFISGEQDLSPTQAWYDNYYQTNPSGEIAWTPADLNSGEWGIQLTY